MAHPLTYALAQIYTHAHIRNSADKTLTTRFRSATSFRFFFKKVQMDEWEDARRRFYRKDCSMLADEGKRI